MKYQVVIEKVVSDTFDFDAESPREAMRLAREALDAGEIEVEQYQPEEFRIGVFDGFHFMREEDDDV